MFIGLSKYGEADPQLVTAYWRWEQTRL